MTNLSDVPPHSSIPESLSLFQCGPFIPPSAEVRLIQRPYSRLWPGCCAGSALWRSHRSVFMGPYWLLWDDVTHNGPRVLPKPSLATSAPPKEAALLVSFPTPPLLSSSSLPAVPLPSEREATEEERPLHPIESLYSLLYSLPRTAAQRGEIWEEWSDARADPRDGYCN